MKVRGLSLIGHVGRAESGGIEVIHAAHINLVNGKRRTFAQRGELPADATKEQIAEMFGRTARESLLDALENA